MRSDSQVHQTKNENQTWGLNKNYLVSDQKEAFSHAHQGDWQMDTSNHHSSWFWMFRIFPLLTPPNFASPAFSYFFHFSLIAQPGYFEFPNYLHQIVFQHTCFEMNKNEKLFSFAGQAHDVSSRVAEVSHWAGQFSRFSKVSKGFHTEQFNFKVFKRITKVSHWAGQFQGFQKVSKGQKMFDTEQVSFSRFPKESKGQKRFHTEQVSLSRFSKA